MVIVRWWIVVSLHRRKRNRISGGGSVEDGRCGPWAQDFEGGEHSKIMEVAQDGGSQFANRAGETLIASREAIQLSIPREGSGKVLFNCKHSIGGVTLSFKGNHS
ncbi:hypothetical protein DPMN_012193 [Dreissena polymorpha]|uniref:Uncharacterized protein n=1 Tax=Dreissena polymorpha TaxID=45954 RepID=A0A9D4S2I3_DREPO|nr:hypothetical protein DPMN_012193 [Dreissena polymorpha]